MEVKLHRSKTSTWVIQYKSVIAAGNSYLTSANACATSLVSSVGSGMARSGWLNVI